MKYVHISTWNGQDMDIHNYAKIVDVDSETYLESLIEPDFEVNKKDRMLEYFTLDDDGEIIDFGRHTLIPYEGHFAVDISCNINTFDILTKDEYKVARKGFYDDGEYYRNVIKIS